MKKTYIAPEVKPYDLTVVSMLMQLSAINHESTNEDCVKQETQTGDDMWNLYDK